MLDVDHVNEETKLMKKYLKAVEELNDKAKEAKDLTVEFNTLYQIHLTKLSILTNESDLRMKQEAEARMEEAKKAQEDLMKIQQDKQDNEPAIEGEAVSAE